MSEKPPYTYLALCRYHGENSRNMKDGDFLLRNPKRNSNVVGSYNVFRAGQWTQNRYRLPLNGEVKKIPVEQTPAMFWPNVRDNMIVIIRDEILYEIGHVLPLGPATRITIKRTLAWRPSVREWTWGWLNKGMWTILGHEMRKSPVFSDMLALPDVWQQRVFEASLRSE
jgi:hypothetical protein